MKLIPGVLSLALAAAAFGVAAAPARADFSDSLCPEASQYVTALASIHAAPPLGPTAGGDPPQKVYDAVHAATLAYDTCAKRHLASAEIEPAAHYAYTREAGFGILEARALRALGRTADAKAAAQNSRRLAQDVAEWRQSIGQNGAVISSSGSDNRPSRYRDSAREIVTSADALLAELSATPAPAPAPAASPHR